VSKPENALLKTLRGFFTRRTNPLQGMVLVDDQVRDVAQQVYRLAEPDLRLHEMHTLDSWSWYTPLILGYLSGAAEAVLEGEGGILKADLIAVLAAELLLGDQAAAEAVFGKQAEFSGTNLYVIGQHMGRDDVCMPDSHGTGGSTSHFALISYHPRNPATDPKFVALTRLVCPETTTKAERAILGEVAKQILSMVTFQLLQPDLVSPQSWGEWRPLILGYICGASATVCAASNIGAKSEYAAMLGCLSLMP
jgi:hypothetical protein